MVKSIKILNGFLTEMPGFHPGIQFDFEADKVNCFFGPNAAGKSTIMKMIKSYCGIEKGGWSKISSELALGAQCQAHFPWVYRAYSPASSDCVVEWDGIASFYNDGDIKIDEWAWFSNNISLSEDGMTSESEQFQYLMDKPSSGQYRMIKINKLLNMAKNPPDLTAYVSAHPTQRAESDYIRTLPRNGKPTLILDEPERALSLPKQMELFKLLNELTSEYQIIIATHSPFVLFQEDMKIFNIEEGYSDKCLDIFRQCVETNINKENETL
jgi:predicted ATPase